jgi:2-aminoadipate transaminase
LYGILLKRGIGAALEADAVPDQFSAGQGASSVDLWTSHYAQAAQTIASSAIRDLLKVTEQPNMISLAGGLPAPEIFPTEEIAAATERALIEMPVAALQYGPTDGFGPLREFIAARMQRLGMQIGVENVLITSGSQQGLDLLGRLMVDPGAPVAVESPTYMGALQAWQLVRPTYLTVPVDADGMDVNALAALLEAGHQPRFLYIVSSFQNPTGVTLTPTRRQALIELAERYNLPIVEDDPYGELVFEGERAVPLATLDSRRHGELRNVVYLGTFSKLLTPGLRIGWMVAPTSVVRQVGMIKQGVDLHTGSMAQVAAYLTVKDGLLDELIPKLCALYRTRRDALRAALEQYLTPYAEWNEPTGGMFFWLKLRDGRNATQLLQRALQHNVAFVPGAPFYPNGGGDDTLRLNYSNVPPERLVEGVRRLAAALTES